MGSSFALSLLHLSNGPVPFPLPFSAPEFRKHLADKWLPYGLLPFHLSLFLELRKEGRPVYELGWAPFSSLLGLLREGTGRKEGTLHPTAVQVQVSHSFSAMHLSLSSVIYRAESTAVLYLYPQDGGVTTELRSQTTVGVLTCYCASLGW